MTQYISRKSDASSKPPTQTPKPNVWTPLEVESRIVLLPTESSKSGATWGTYLNVTTPKLGGASELTIRWTREPAGINDSTGYTTFPLNKGRTTFISHLWMFQAKIGQAVVLQVRVNGKATIKTREVKLSIP